MNKYLDDLESNAETGFYNEKARRAIYLFHLYRHTNDQDAEDSAFSLLKDVTNNMSIEMGIGFENGLSGIGAGISYLIRNDFLEGDENKTLAEIDFFLFNYLYNTIHTDLSLNTGVLGVGHYFLNRIKSKTAGERNFRSIKIKMWLIMILDILATQFNLNGYTFMEPKALSCREIVDIEYFLLCFIENNICNELSYRIMKNFNRMYPYPAYNNLDLLKKAELSGCNPHSSLKSLKEDEIYQNRIQQKLAGLSITNPSLPAWWRLF